MKYYSEELNKLFDSEKEALKAEKDHAAALKAEEEKKAKMNSERAAAAKEVEQALDALKAAKKEYHEKLSAFCEKYGTYHTSIKDADLPDLFSIWEDFFNF